MKYFFTYIFFTFCFFGFAQIRENSSIDTTFLNFKGILNVSELPHQNKQYLITFNSKDQLKDSLKTFEINGKQANQKRINAWNFKKQDFNFTIENVNFQNNNPLITNLNGEEFVLTAQFKNSIPTGKWKLEHNNVINNKSQKTIQFETNFNINGFPEGVFVINQLKNGFLNTVKGNFDKKGFFDGNLELKYKINGEFFQEIRVYDNGFLKTLKIFNSKDNSLLVDMVYDDVYHKLDQLKNKLNAEFEISEQGFGVFFNVGYNSFDPKLTLQENGNKILTDVFDLIEAWNNFDQSDIKLGFNLTKRFKIAYPKNDSITLANIQKKNDTLLKLTENFISKPRMILNKQKSYLLTEAFHYLKKSNEKLYAIDSVIQKNNGGFFDFISRDDYYAEGIPGLQVKDSLEFIFETDEFKIPFEDSLRITSNNNLLDHILSYIEFLDPKIQKLISFSYNELQVYDQAAYIDTLDQKIVSNLAQYDSLYLPKREIYVNQDFENKPLYYNLLDATYVMLISNLNKKYIAEKDLTKKKQIADELLCIMDFFIYNDVQLSMLEKFDERVNRIFTRSAENPFYERELENKIYPNINRKSREVLFKSYINSMLRANSCQELIQPYRKIMQLEEKLQKLSNQNDKSVQDIDRVLRRENLPSRIERVLGLN